MIRHQTVSLVIPCKNEAKALAALLRKAPKYLDEIIVVDNNSSDNTRAVAKKMGAKVVSETRTDTQGIGYGFAHQKGIQIAKSQYVITLDGDNTYPITDIKKVIEYVIDHNLDVVSCNRFPLKRQHAISRIRQLGVWILNAEVKLLYGFPMQDILTGMWAGKRTELRRLQLQEGGWNLSPEIKLAALYNSTIRFSEFHIDHEYRYDGDSKQIIWMTGFDHLFYILRRRLLQDNSVALATIYSLDSLNKTFRTIWRELKNIGLQPAAEIV